MLSLPWLCFKNAPKYAELVVYALKVPSPGLVEKKEKLWGNWSSFVVTLSSLQHRYYKYFY